VIVQGLQKVQSGSTVKIKPTERAKGE
jgi:hypothetical protein